jgi:membrane protease YdiL (CAAX protease family)
MGSSIVSETTVHFRQWAAWLPLALSGAAGHAVFLGDPWMLCVHVVLLGALDVSVWQKLDAELPWLTEPAEDPPPRLFQMHGQLAAYGYITLQGFAMVLLAGAKLPPGVVITVASALAAAVVAALTAWLLLRRNVRILPPHPEPLPFSFVYGAAGLLLGVTAGYLWLFTLRSTSWGVELMKKSAPSISFPGDAANWWGIVALAVIVAPVCEEFIFRGLVYHGLRRTNGVAWSILWSSLFFTAVHPFPSSAAVFTLAAINAYVVERTGRLTPCIFIHAGYNAFMVWLQH